VEGGGWEKIETWARQTSVLACPDAFPSFSSFLSFLPSLLPFLSLRFPNMTSSARMTLRVLEDTDYRNAKALLAERFCSADVQNFVDLWRWRNYYASICVEQFGAIIAFGVVWENKLEYLVVSPHFEGCGMGGILVEYIVEELKAQEYKTVMLLTADNPALRRFYSRLGFELSSSSRDSAGISGDIMVMRFREKRRARAPVRFM
jgi:predicted N-acetyltransferase YhbS